MSIGERSVFYYLLILLLTTGVIQGLIIGFLFFLKRSGVKRANFFYGLLLIAFALTLLHNILTLSGVFDAFPQLKFLPIYFTLALPPLFFYHVKINLYPNYHFKWSDSKHLVLPLGQFGFLMIAFFYTVERKVTMGRTFLNPFYGGMEQFLYLFTFFLYIYFAYKYIQHKQKQLTTKRKNKRINYLRILVKVFLMFFLVHACFVVSDFVSYEFLNINLRSLKVFVALGALSFGLLVLWLGIYGFQVLVWGRKLFYS